MPIFDRPASGYTPKIRIINLVDILLVLLLFLFITTTFRAETPSVVEVELPEAKTAKPEVEEEKRERARVSIGPDETIYFNEQEVTGDELEAALVRAKENDPSIVLQFAADKSVSYGRIVLVVDAARAAGIRNITAFTKRSVTTDE